MRYCNRPFTTVDEMNDHIIGNWNAMIDNEDEVYVLGDVGFDKHKTLENYLRRLNGIKYLIRGNHDKHLDEEMLLKYFKWIKDYHLCRVLDKDGADGKWQYISLFHYACRTWDMSHYGSWSLFGHSHGTLKNDPNLLSWDIGVDNNNFMPLEYTQIKTIMQSRKDR
jgi:calcineurin-like phosphoesterase family protein